jgi:hypothetical protein
VHVKPVSMLVMALNVLAKAVGVLVKSVSMVVKAKRVLVKALSVIVMAVCVPRVHENASPPTFESACLLYTSSQTIAKIK